MNTIILIFLYLGIAHLFFTWYINSNIIVNCKKFFISKETYNKFFDTCQRIMYAPFKFKYQKAWDIIKDIYNPSYAKFIDYLYETSIKDFWRCFLKCYINKVLHFNTTITSCGKEPFAILKRQLSTSTSNLKQVVDGIVLLLINEIYNYFLAFAAAQIQYSTKLHLSNFQQLATFIPQYALKLIIS